MEIMKSVALSVALITFIVVSGHGYNTPTPLVELLETGGFRVSIPDAPGIQLFAFHGNINKEMEGNEAGDYSADVLRQRNGRWTYKNRYASLNRGDTLYFWTHVRVNGVGYEKFFQQYHVPGDCVPVPDDTIRPTRW